MYQVYFDDYPLYDPRSDTLRIRDPEVRLAVGESGEMRFVLDRDHPNAGKVTRLRGHVRLLAGGTQIFKGRVKRDTRDFYLDREIEVEGLLACLNDSIIPPFSFPADFLDDAGYQAAAAAGGNVVEFFLGWLLSQHNSQVGPGQQIELGDVTVADPNNYLFRESSKHTPTMEIVQKKLEALGGYLVADYSADVPRLHLYADLPLTNIQPVEFSKNLLDLISELDSTETYTAILPIGQDGLTIEELPDGELSPGIVKQGRIIYSETAEVETGGRITRTVEWSDVTLAENLRTKAVAQLTGDGVKTVQTITARAVDLGGSSGPSTGGGSAPGRSAVVGQAVVGQAVVGAPLGAASGVDLIPHFVVGRYIPVKSPPHGFADSYPLMELEPNILNPGDTEITLGATTKAASDINHGKQNATEERQEQIEIELGKQQGAMTELAESTRTQITETIQTCESLIFSALDDYVERGNYEEFRRTVESQLSIMANEISLGFTEITQQITDVNGDLQSTVTTLNKFFKFGTTGLTIQSGENDMGLRLDNGLIIFTKNGQQFGWWDGVDFHTGNIVIDVTERAQFGSFAFVPRSNGSLSFLKVGG